MGRSSLKSPPTELIRQFSGSAYRVETEEAIDPQRLSKIAALGAEVQTNQIIHIGDPALFSQVLEILKPLPLLQVQKDQANLTDVFLKLVRGEGG
jgi:hypothetical protein